MLYSANKVPSQLSHLDMDSILCYAIEFLDLDEDLEVDVIFYDLGEGKCGHVEYDEELFEVHLNSNLSQDEFIRTLFHELVHVQQITSGSYNPDTSEWHGIIYTCTYNKLPWEKEAYVLEEEMFNGYN